GGTDEALRSGGSDRALGSDRTSRSLHALDAVAHVAGLGGHHLGIVEHAALVGIQAHFHAGPSREAIRAPELMRRAHERIEAGRSRDAVDTWRPPRAVATPLTALGSVPADTAGGAGGPGRLAAAHHRHAVAHVLGSATGHQAHAARGAIRAGALAASHHRD